MEFFWDQDSHFTDRHSTLTLPKHYSEEFISSNFIIIDIAVVEALCYKPEGRRFEIV
jgi:hypothetical protein